MGRIEDLKRLEKEARPGKWEVSDDTWCDEPTIPQAEIGDNCLSRNNAEFIVAARNAMPALLKVVEAIRPLANKWKDMPIIDDEVYHQRQAVVDALRELEGDK